MFAATVMVCGHLSLRVTDLAFEVLTETGRLDPCLKVRGSNG